MKRNTELFYPVLVEFIVKFKNYDLISLKVNLMYIFTVP